MNSAEFKINKTWDGADVPLHDEVNIKVTGTDDGDCITLNVECPYHHDDPPPDVKQGSPYPGLWEYEVVEAFFLNDRDQYLEVELSPHGAHLVLMCDGYRKVKKDCWPLKFSSDIKDRKWSGQAEIPTVYFPPKVKKFNAYYIHGQRDDRTYMALYPASNGQFEEPDFHRLQLFKEFKFQDMCAKNHEDTFSSEHWNN